MTRWWRRVMETRTSGTFVLGGGRKLKDHGSNVRVRSLRELLRGAGIIGRRGEK